MSSHKKVFQKESSGNRKSINTGNISPNAYLAKKPTWKFNKCDLSSTKWSILDVKSFDRDVLYKLIAYEGMTWAEIQSASGGKSSGNGTNNHFENICDMSKDAQKRANYLHLDVDSEYAGRISVSPEVYISVK